MADKVKEYQGYYDYYFHKFENLKGHQGIAAITQAQITDVDTKIATLAQHIRDRKWGDFDTVAGEVGGKIQSFRLKAFIHGDYVGLRNNALQMVQALEAHPNTSAITADITAIKTNKIEKAKEEYETNDKYLDAKALLKTVEADYNTAKGKADTAANTAYTTARDQAKQKLTALDVPEKQAVVADEIAAIKAKLDKAEKYANAKQYPEALALVTQAESDCQDAETLAARLIADANAAKEASDATKDFGKDPQAAVDKVQKLHDQLKSHPHVVAIQDGLSDVQTKIEDAKKLIA